MTDNIEMAKAIRSLSLDMIDAAKSGHPGAPLGMADVAYILWHKFLKHNPANPSFINRDRFVLSNGHASAMLYALLHLTGYNLKVNDLKAFRQLASKTPGHPEYGVTDGVEVTTGPLGQGLAIAVGMAIAQTSLAKEYNTNDIKLIDNYTYAFVGDGCLMEGISHEASSLAGTYKLGKLIVFYDSNNISIDGNTSQWFDENLKARYEAYNWQVVDIDGHNYQEIYDAISLARSTTDMPSIIVCRTKIGYGSRLESSENCHGAAFDSKDLKYTREKLAINGQPFSVEKDIQKVWHSIDKGKILEEDWDKKFSQYKLKFPNKAKDFSRRVQSKAINTNNLKNKLVDSLVSKKQSDDLLATRFASKLVLDLISKDMNELFGGSADLSVSTGAKARDMQSYTAANNEGKYLHCGVREFAMQSIMNGLALYGGFIPYSSTFLAFLDYNKASFRLAAMMKLRVILILTHDSIALGEDGPTHQPVEQLTTLRAIPNSYTFRPCNMLEVISAWCFSLKTFSPTALILSRQKMPIYKDSNYSENIDKGAYIYYEKEKLKEPNLIIIATGSEVHLAMQAITKFYKDNDKAQREKINIRLVSMFCMELFEEQDGNYAESVLPKSVTKRIIIEAGSSIVWHKYASVYGKIIGVDTYGSSAKEPDVLSKFGFSVDNLVTEISEYLVDFNKKM